LATAKAFNRSKTPTTWSEAQAKEGLRFLPVLKFINFQTSFLKKKRKQQQLSIG